MLRRNVRFMTVIRVHLHHAPALKTPLPFRFNGLKTGALGCMTGLGLGHDQRKPDLSEMRALRRSIGCVARADPVLAFEPDRGDSDSM